MDFLLQIEIPKPLSTIAHHNKVMLTGSCFTEHMSTRMQQIKMQVLSNPNGILFNPLSVVQSLERIIQQHQYHVNDVFLWNELYQSWDYHSDFAAVQPEQAVAKMNHSIQSAHAFLKSADWLIITVGSAYQYFDQRSQPPIPVANCHRAPGTWFEKRLLAIDTITAAMQQLIAQLQIFNPALQIIFTVSPVRHSRDGIIQNNRSKARLLEAIHTIVENNAHCYYFPAYELAIDVLRDYRFYDIDLVHPNYACTQYIWEQFCQHYMSSETLHTAQLMKDIHTAFQHRIRYPNTEAHQKFKQQYLTKIQQLQQAYPYVDFSNELVHFTT